MEVYLQEPMEIVATVQNIQQNTHQTVKHQHMKNTIQEMQHTKYTKKVTVYGLVMLLFLFARQNRSFYVEAILEGAKMHGVFALDFDNGTDDSHHGSFRVVLPGT